MVAGQSSLNWIVKELRPKQWSAVTASEKCLASPLLLSIEQLLHRTRDLVSTPTLQKRMRGDDQLVVGNWRVCNLAHELPVGLRLRVGGSTECELAGGGDVRLSSVGSPCG